MGKTLSTYFSCVCSFVCYNKSMKESKWKKGDKVGNRVIVQVVPCLDYGGKPSYRYGYKYEHEPENVDLIWCAESTIIRKLKQL